MTFKWDSKSPRYLRSREIVILKEFKNLRVPLFIQKSNDEGIEFYYMGDITPIHGSFEQVKMKGNKGKDVAVVKVKFSMNQPV